MDNGKKFIERRKHLRFKVKRGAVAAMITTSSANEEQAEDIPMNEESIATIQMGQITNISKGGLGFRYFYGEDEHNKLFDLDIFSVQDSFYLKKVPVNTVWVSHEVSNPSLSLLESQHRGLQFEELTPHQIFQLDFFLRNYTYK